MRRRQALPAASSIRGSDMSVKSSRKALITMSDYSAITLEMAASRIPRDEMCVYKARNLMPNMPDKRNEAATSNRDFTNDEGNKLGEWKLPRGWRAYTRVK